MVQPLDEEDHHPTGIVLGSGMRLTCRGWHMRFDESANGSEIQLSSGEEFDLVLPETPTAGYRWILKNENGVGCSQLESSHSAGGKIGGAGTQSWRFRAPASGTCSVILEYRRSWETSSEPARTFTLKVRVRP